MARDVSPRKPPVEDEDDFDLTDDVEETKSRRKLIVPSKKTLIVPSDRPVIVRAAKARDTIITKQVSLEDRKLNKKQEAGLAKWKGKQRGKQIDAVFLSHADRTRAKFGNKSVYVGDQSDSLVICIPTPSLAFEFLIAQDGFPLGLIYQLVSETGIGKSALLAEFGRWFNLAGGGLEVFENETKFNEKWYRSILGQHIFEHTPINRCKSVEDWQRMLTFSTAGWKATMTGTKEEPGPGRTFPVLLGIDSIMGKPSENTAEKIMGKVGKNGTRGTTGAGHAGRGFPEEALIITKYLRTYPAEMDNWPFSLVMVNHLKMSKDDMGNDARGKAGGKQVDFQESFELELSRVGGPKKKIQCQEYEGYPVALTCWKNSFGPGQRRIQTRILWYYEVDPDTGDFEQKTVWDWDWSTVWLLNNILQGDKADPLLRKSLQDAEIHINCPTNSDIENTAWSKTLGMKKGDALSWTEVGAMFRKNRKLMRRIKNALFINRRAVLAGEYLDQLDALLEDLS